MNIAYSFDDNYSKYAGISLLSLLENNQDIEIINVYIIGENLAEENVRKLNKIASDYGRNITFIEIDDILPSMEEIPAFGKSPYGRLFLSSCINADTVFYFDSDTIINGSLSELLKLDMDEFLVAGVQDSVNRYYLSLIGLDSSDRYINSGGVIAINLSLWKEMNMEEKCINFIKFFDGAPPHHDQGTINNVCRGKIHILDPEYNLMNPMFMFSGDEFRSLFRIDYYYTQKQLNKAIKSPIVIHYTSEFFNRPWFSNCTHPYKNIFLEYMNRSPWRLEIIHKELSRNCRIQNFVYNNFSFAIYKIMIRYIELKHKIMSSGANYLEKFRSRG